MTISPPLSTALHAIGGIMIDARDRWWIIGSAAVALHGAEPGHVEDVDVLLSVADARCILPKIGIEPQRGSAHEAFRSRIFGIWSGATLPVEFMAGFYHRSGDCWRPVRPSTRDAVQVAGEMVFVPDLIELQAMLSAFGRSKDLERARSLAGMMPKVPTA